MGADNNAVGDPSSLHRASKKYGIITGVNKYIKNASRSSVSIIDSNLILCVLG